MSTNGILTNTCISRKNLSLLRTHTIQLIVMAADLAVRFSLCDDRSFTTMSSSGYYSGAIVCTHYRHGLFPFATLSFFYLSFVFSFIVGYWSLL